MNNEKFATADGTPEGNSSLFTLHSSLKSAPLSYAQTGVYFDCMKNPTSTLYNTPVCLTFPVETDAEALKKAAVQAVENHPALFVQFTTNETGVVQVMGDRETPIEVEDYTISTRLPPRLRTPLQFGQGPSLPLSHHPYGKSTLSILRHSSPGV